MNPIIVIGPPRSGTSVVARLLQEKLGIMMDEGPIKKDRHNPLGYYEDHQVVGINNRMIDRSPTVDKIDPLWAVEFAQWISYRMIRYKEWGFKDPRIVGFLPWVRQFFNNVTWIVTDRKDKQIIDSQVNKIGVPPKLAVSGLCAYRKLIANIKRYSLIDMCNERSLPGLTEQLKGIINGC